MRVMKDSGIDWISDIPETWKVLKIKNIAEIYTGNSISDEKKDDYTNAIDSYPYISTKDIDANTNEIVYDNGLYIKKDDKSFKIAPKDSILLCIEGGSAGKKISFTKQAVCFVNKLCCIKANDVAYDKYIYYYCNCDAFICPFNINMSGLIGGVSTKLLNHISISLPTKKEQKKIIDFLDRKCALIDSTIEKQKTVIEKLKLYKQSIITEAVTKGLDKNAKMKPSGIDWIGDIPEGWEIRKLKNIVELKNEKCLSKHDDAYVGLENIESWTGKYLISESEYQSDVMVSRFATQDLLFGKLRPYLAKCWKAEFSGVCSSEFLVMNSSNFNLSFLFHTLLSHWFINIVDSSTYGTKMPRANWSFIGNMLIPIPSDADQQAIADYLDEKCAGIDTAIVNKQKVIDKLTDYKKSLIYECVTGKRVI